MSLNMERFSRQGQESIYAAHRLVSGYTQQQMEPEHLLLAILEQKDEEIVSQALLTLHVDIGPIKGALHNHISRLARSSSFVDEVYLSKSSEKIIRRAEMELEAFHDELICPEHIFLALVSTPGTIAYEKLVTGKLQLDSVQKTIIDIRGNKRISKDTQETPMEFLGKYCQDLVALAQQNKLDPVIGRDEEVRRVIQVLSRRTKNNPVLIGDPGVGKTAIIEGLAQRIHLGDVPETLKNRKLLSLDLGSLIAGAKFRGEFEDRLKGVLQAIEQSGGSIILFIDELHTLVGAGASEGALDASNMLKPALARGELRCIGATTTVEFKKYIEKDAALERRFQQVVVSEPDVDSAIAILRGLKEKYEVHHGVRIKDAAIIAAANLSQRYITERFLPDKAIDLIDESASKLRIEIDSLPTEIDQIDRKILQLEIERAALKKEEDEVSASRLRMIEKELVGLGTKSSFLKEQWHKERDAIQKLRGLKQAIEEAKQKELEAQRAGNLELAARLKYGTLDNLEKELQKANEILNKSEQGNRILKEEVDEEDVAEIVSRWTGIPVSRMLLGEREKLIHMEKKLAERLIGQKKAVIAVSNAIRRARTGIQSPDRPLGSFIFMGSSGVGKTELASALAEFLFNDEKAIVRLDMSEYMEKHAVSRLIGAPPGYVGFEEGGILTEAIRRKPYSVLLFDEIEKGHPDIFNLLLQILDEGHLTDSKGVTVGFKNTIIILTSNLGSETILAFQQQKQQVDEQLSRKILLGHFRPEFLNRLDDIIVFQPLEMTDLKKIVHIQLQLLQQRLCSKNIQLKILTDTEEYLARKGFDPEFGARPLKRIIQNQVENALAYHLLDGSLNEGDTIQIGVEGEELTFHRVR